MKISCNWLRNYIETDLNVEEIADILTNTGLEVEEIEPWSENKELSDQLVVGYVKEVNKHPDADKLTVCMVDTGTGTDSQIICGAPNVAAGQKVVVAPVGSELISVTGVKINLKKAKIRGVFSEGMICAADEIGLGEDHTGIIVLPDHATTGQSYRDFLGIQSDNILEISITPNRGDAVSHIGVARDLAAVLKKRIIYPDVGSFAIESARDDIRVIVEDSLLCPRYSAIVVSGIKVAESPAWLKNRLKSIGQNPVNNVVDVTNFILHEMGQPLHSFDLDLIEGGKVIVRNEKKGYKFITLTRNEVELDGSEIMICDALKPIAMGGVMGGFNSMISENTTSILIESACFNPGMIRRTSKKHGIISDASYRFERGSDPEITIYALKRAALLICELAGGHITSGIMDCYPGKKERNTIDLSFEYLNQFTGYKIEKEEVISILSGLEYTIVKSENDFLKIEVPAFRSDVSRPVDLAEEILRIYSYEKIKISGELTSSLPPKMEDNGVKLVNRITDYLVSAGFYEMLSPSFINTDYASINQLNDESSAIKTLDAKNSNFDTLKSRIIIPGLESIGFNMRRNVLNLKFFEFSKSYYFEKEKYIESEKLGLWITGTVNEQSWYEKEKEVDYYLLKSYLQNIFRLAGMRQEPEFKDSRDSLFSQGYEVFFHDKKIASLGLVNPEIVLNFDIRKNVYFCEIEMNILRKESKRDTVLYQPPARFPFITRDISLAIKEEILFSRLKETILSVKSGFLKEIKVADVYKGDQVGEGRKSYLIRLKFQDDEKTLKDEQVDSIILKMISLLETRFDAIVRK